MKILTFCEKLFSFHLTKVYLFIYIKMGKGGYGEQRGGGRGGFRGGIVPN